MESKANYFIVGLTVLILAAALLIAALWLSVGFNQKTYNTYTVYISEAISGLSDESPVKFNGVKVGFIKDIQLSDTDPKQVRLHVGIEEGTPITTTTSATLISQGITGTTYLGLSSTSSTLIPLQKTPGEPYPVIPFKPSFFNLLEKNVTEATNGIKRVFDKENAQHLKKALANLEQVSTMIEKNNENLNKALNDLPSLIIEMKNSMRQFSTMSNDISSAGLQLSETMRAGRSSIGKISQQAIPPAVLLLRRLNLIAANLEKVSAQMRQNPAVIIRGSAAPKPGPGERR